MLRCRIDSPFGKEHRELDKVDLFDDSDAETTIGYYYVCSDVGFVGHSARVLDGVEPVVPWHLCLGEVRPCHGAHGGPRALGQAVGGLPAGGGANDFGLLVIDPAASLTP